MPLQDSKVIVKKSNIIQNFDDKIIRTPQMQIITTTNVFDEMKCKPMKYSHEVQKGVFAG